MVWMQVTERALEELRRIGFGQITLTATVYCCDVLVDIAQGRGEVLVFSRDGVEIYADEGMVDLLANATLDYDGGFVLRV